MDSVRHIITASALRPAGSDSGIDASSCNSGNNSAISNQAFSGGSGRRGGSEGGTVGDGRGGGDDGGVVSGVLGVRDVHTSHSDATSAIHDLSGDVNDLPDDASPLTEDEATVSNNDYDDDDDDGNDATGACEADTNTNSSTGDVHANASGGVIVIGGGSSDDPLRTALQINVEPDALGQQTEDNNLMFHSSRAAAQLRDRTRMASKEEKQRQNEEIVIMESSSVSSETGSWESVFPQRITPIATSAVIVGDDAAAAITPLAAPIEENCSFDSEEASGTTAGNRHAMPKAAGKETMTVRLPDFSFKPNSLVAASSACFIDASSLMDESELYASNTQLGPQLPEIACRGPRPELILDTAATSTAMQPPTTDAVVVSAELHSPNLSDEQKLLHRIGPEPMDRSTNAPLTNPDYDIQDQFASGPPPSLINMLLDGDTNMQSLNDTNMQSLQSVVEPITVSHHHVTEQSQPPSSLLNQFGAVNSAATTTSSAPAIHDPADQTRHRQDLERKQGHFLFRNSIQHFSGQVLSSVRSMFHDRDDTHAPTSDMSLPSIYSTGSGELGALASLDTNASTGATSCSLYSSEPESGFYPDTPHNSIAHIDVPLVPQQPPQPSGTAAASAPPATKHSHSADDRMRPGQVEEPAATIFRPPFDSPSVRRKTETCPILSGGLQTEDLHDDEAATRASRIGSFREKSLSASLNSWVVDMSDCRSPKPERRRLDSVSSVASGVSSSGPSGFTQSLDTRRSSMGTGFFVNLTDCPSSLPPNLNLGNLKEVIDDGPASDRSGPAEAEKKNIFSMFIDFGDNKPVTARREPHAALAARLSQSMRRADSPSETVSDRGETAASKPQSTPAIVRRTPTAARRCMDPRMRHSWTEPNKAASISGGGGSSTTTTRRVEYISSMSMPTGDNNGGSVSGSSSIMSILDKIPLISKTSSMSVDSPQSPFDDITTTSCSKSMSVYSNNSGKSMSASADEAAAANKCGADTAPHVRKRRQDVEINETFDKSSRSSLPEEQLSTDTSPITDTDDVTFQNDMDPDPMLDTILEQGGGGGAEIASSNSSGAAHKVEATAEEAAAAAHTMETLQAIMERQQKLLLETVAEEPPPVSTAVASTSSAFVKLSDMDKPAPKFELHSTEAEGLSQSLGAGANRIERLFGENSSRRSGRHSMHLMSRSTGNNNNLSTLASSSENMKSLSRLFPHLSKDLSNSMPADMQVDDATPTTIGANNGSMHKSPNSILDQDLHDLSAASSVTSSFSRSAIDSADESSLSYRQPRRLGEDLLKMFLQEIATDVTVEAAGRRMRAHKCILRSRCQYFAAILAGNWVQAAGNVITLPGYSYGAVHFALCHIYSGAAHPPQGISLIELAALADLMGLEGLKEVTAYALRTHYCHNFHKPCSGCIDGILQVFPVTLNHGLDELYRKCLRWTCKHYVKVWPTRSFAQLPADIVARCSQHLVAHMNSETVLDTILELDHLLTLVAPCRWAIGIENTIRDIIDAAHAYMADHFASLMASDSFLSLGQGQSWNISRLEHLLLRTATSLSAEQACRSYQRVTRLNAVLHARSLQSAAQTPTDGIGGVLLRPNGGADGDGDEEQEIEWNVDFLRLVDDVLNAVQHCLTNQCSRAMRTAQWQRMDLDLRRKIQKLACLAEPPDRRSSQLTKPLVYNSVPSASNSPIHHSRTQDLYAVKLAIQAQTKRAQESVRLRDQQRVAPPPPERPTTLHFRGSSASAALANTDRHERHSWQPPSSSSQQHTTATYDSARHANTAKAIRQQQPSAPVPDLIPTNTTCSKRSANAASTLTTAAVVGHRRTQSDSNNHIVARNSTYPQPSYGTTNDTTTSANNAAPTTTVTRKTPEVRPRYLDTKPKRNNTSGNSNHGSQGDNNHGALLHPHQHLATTGDRVNSHSSSDSGSTRTPKHIVTLAANKRLNNNPISTMTGKHTGTAAQAAKQRPQSAGVLAVATATASAMGGASSEVDLSVDSLGGSMHSSIRSNKTASQESLNLYNATVRANNAAKTAKALAAQQSKQQQEAFTKSAPSATMSAVSRLRKPTPILLSAVRRSQGKTSSTASTATTTTTTGSKSSRLPSVNSATSSPRDIAPSSVHPHSSSVGNSRPGSSALAAAGAAGSSVVRKSFLNARSKEILASKRGTSTAMVPALTSNNAAATKRSSTSTGIPTATNGEYPHAIVHPVNKSSSTSAIQAKRPASFPTTLHLRRTAKLTSPLPHSAATNATTEVENTKKTPRSPHTKFTRNDPKREPVARRPHQQQQPARKQANGHPPVIPTDNNCQVNGAREQSVHTTSNTVRYDDDDDEECFVAPPAATRIESKLERSSTFCKESSTLDVSDLLVIE